MPLGVASDAACMAWPRRRTTSSPAAKSIAPAKTRAVYSPRLSPAAPWQPSTTAGSLAFRLSRAARLATKIAGWLTSVASSASAGPSKQSVRRSNPRTSSGAIEQSRGRRAAPGRVPCTSRRPGHPGRETGRRSWTWSVNLGGIPRTGAASVRSFLAVVSSLRVRRSALRAQLFDDPVIEALRRPSRGRPAGRS